MKRLTAQMQMYVAIAIVAVLTLAAVFFGILPLLQEAATLDAQIETEQSAVAAAQALVARRQSAKAQSAANEVELMRISNQIPDSPQLPAVIIEVQDVANAAGVELPQLAVGDVVPAAALADGTIPPYSELELTIIVRGDWAEVIDFCRRLNALDRGVRFTTSTFVYIPGDAEAGVEEYVEGQATLEVYTMAAPTTAIVPGSATTTGQ